MCGCVHQCKATSYSFGNVTLNVPKILAAALSNVKPSTAVAACDVFLSVLLASKASMK